MLHFTAHQLGHTVSYTSTVAVVEAEDQPTGGWGWYDYDQARRDEDRKQRAKDKKAALEIADKLHRELALAERAIEEEGARTAELARLNKLVEQNKGPLEALESKRLNFVMREALEEKTFSKLERLERELKIMREEELFMMQATIILLNQRGVR